MALRNGLRRMREALKSTRSPARRRPCTLHFDRLEDRLTPVVGAFSVPNAVAAGIGWDGVVDLNNGGCTGALLYTGRHVLTAAHCLTNATGQINTPSVNVGFDLPGRRVTMNVPQANYRIHAGWRGWNSSWNNDMAILDLPALAPSGPRGVGAERYDIFRGSNEVGQNFTFYGYGRLGTGNNGDNLAADGRKHVGQNRFERTVGTLLEFDFDNGNSNNDLFGRRFSISNTGLGAAEAMNAPGDSGGPSFLGNQIATVTSYRGSFNGTEDVRVGLNSSFGDYGGYTRVSPNAFWIDYSLSGRHDLILDMQAQLVGQDANPDTIEVRRNGTFLDIYVNGQFYHRDTWRDVGRFNFYGSAANDTLIVPADLSVDFGSIVDGRGGVDRLIINNSSRTSTYTVTSTYVDITGAPTTSFTYRNMEDVTVGADSTDTVNLWSTAAATPVTVVEAGTVVVGPGGRVADIRGAVTIRNQPSYTALTINNSADTVTHTVTLTSTGITGLAPAAINWVENDLRSLTIRAGNGLNTFQILNTPRSPVPGGLTTTLTCGTGIDTVNVRGTNGALVINGNGNLDVVNVGNAGSVQNIRGVLTVSNSPPGAYTALTVDNSAASPASQNLTLSSASLRGLAPADILYSGGDLRSLNVSLGGSNSFLTVSSTPFGGVAGGVQTSITLGSPLDYVRVWSTSNPLTINGRGAGIGDVTVGDTTNSLSRLFAALTINNASVKFMDQGTVGAQVVAITSTGVTRTGLPAINLNNLVGLEWNAGASADTFRILGNPGRGIVLWTGGGDDTIDLGAADRSLDGFGTVTVLGQGGADRLTLHDEAAAIGHSYVLDRFIAYDRVSRSGAGAEVMVSYQGMAEVSVNAGSGDDTFVFGDGRGLSGHLDGGAGLNTLDYSAWTTGVYVDLLNNVAYQGAAAVYNIAYVFGGAGDDYIHGDARDNWLVGNGGHDILVGDEGGDWLQGGEGNDQLYGGNGWDQLDGGNGEDLLIGGPTAYDNDVAALSEIWAEWTRTDLLYADRIATLRTGTASGYVLDATTVFEDADADLLYGEGDNDWFWGTDGFDVMDRVDPDEVLN